MLWCSYGSQNYGENKGFIQACIGISSTASPRISFGPFKKIEFLLDKIIKNALVLNRD